MGNMLTVGRALGVNNVSELQKLRRLVRSEKYRQGSGSF